MKKIIYRAYLFNVALLVGTPLTVLIAYFGLNYSGFCFAEMRYLSDIEKIKSVFNYQIEHRISERVFDKYIRKNLNCCTINPGGGYNLPPPSFLERITGYNSGDVIVTEFKGYYLDKNGKQKFKKSQYEYFLQNCGTVKEW